MYLRTTAARDWFDQDSAAMLRTPHRMTFDAENGTCMLGVLTRAQEYTKSIGLRQTKSEDAKTYERKKKGRISQHFPFRLKATVPCGRIYGGDAPIGGREKRQGPPPPLGQQREEWPEKKSEHDLVRASKEDSMPARRARFFELAGFLIPGLGSRTCESRARARMSIATPGALAQGSLLTSCLSNLLSHRKQGNSRARHVA